ncbi:unnamed protein product [Echinostoma caproni]|uniref:TROVE domain-containing protein n=1 Tax=Echinostoma caproni TaxID=27848 RepID=A0A183A2I8_9TREM|nr:unnamed protein product [Echinostoma caproni]
MTTYGSKKISLPKPMRRNMIAKFAEFDEYQLGDSHSFVNSRQTYLTMKYLIRILHIHTPTFAVMCLLRKKYPSSATEFVRLGLEGSWDPSLAGTRMKFPSPVTWETELSKNGNNASTWESLISKL